jgi:dermatan/chondrotin sulfate uronyl 2-O-sulfotransferase UST
MDKECDIFASDTALEMAKTNVEKHYAVVGVLERMQESLQVLENYVPFYFKNARQVYKEYMAERHMNKNAIKPKIPAYIMNQMAANFTQELEFYDFCKQRLYRQYLTIK